MKIKIWKYISLIALSIFIAIIVQINNNVYCQSKKCSLVSFKKDNQWGYLDRNGKVIIEPKFERAFDFDDERALVKKYGLWGIIDTQGKWIVVPQYNSASNFFDNVAYVNKDGRYNFIDKNGKYLNGSFDGARDFQEGFGRIKLGDKWGFIDQQGNITIAPQFQEAGPFSDGIARVYNNGKTFYINTLGQTVLELPENIGSGHFSDGVAFIEIGNNDLYGYINTKGKIVIEPQFREVDEFVEGYARVSISGKYGFINKKGTLIVPAKYDTAENFSEGLAVVRIGVIGDKFGYIDQKGDEVIPFKFDVANDFHCGIAYVEIGKKWGFIDTKGNFIKSGTIR